MANQDEEGVPYTDHSANAGQAGERITPSPTPEGERRRSTSAFDKLAPGGDNPRPFGGIGSSESRVTQELRHRVQSMEQAVKDLQEENAKLRDGARRSRSRSSSKQHRRSRSRSPTRQKPKSPPKQRRRSSSSLEVKSSSDDLRERRPRAY
ncbi:hypothetical protein PIB30_022362 [Stylosanthes scabra]|uniref:Uncharacterized protein n=1 Tax=Stylosanthes scabra TaxID=79078 RepID=A0ABU6W7E0_9FABA|nr:hypothetical protein [Stylosanthes scabra]